MLAQHADTRDLVVIEVLWTDKDFSYALRYKRGTDENILGLRWNFNHNPDSKCPDFGSPQQGKNPKWLFIPNNQVDAYCDMLSKFKKADTTAIIKVRLC